MCHWRLSGAENLLGFSAAYLALVQEPDASSLFATPVEDVFVVHFDALLDQWLVSRNKVDGRTVVVSCAAMLPQPRCLHCTLRLTGIYLIAVHRHNHENAVVKVSYLEGCTPCSGS